MNTIEITLQSNIEGRLYAASAQDGGNYHPVYIHGAGFSAENVEWTDEDIQSIREMLDEGTLVARRAKKGGDKCYVLTHRETVVEDTGVLRVEAGTEAEPQGTWAAWIRITDTDTGEVLGDLVKGGYENREEARGEARRGTKMATGYGEVVAQSIQSGPKGQKPS